MSHRARALAESFDRAFATAPRLDVEKSDLALVVRVGTQNHLLRLADVAAVARVPRIVPLPQASRVQLGIAGLRGRLVTVLSLAALLDAEGSDVSKGWLVALAKPAGIALAFDDLDGQIKLAPGTTPATLLDVASLLERAGIAP